MADAPRLSVVMPMRNVAHCVRNILDDLRRQEQLYNPGLEIIVVDDASSDGSPEIVLAWSEQAGMPVTLLRNERQLWSYGSRIAGMARASAPFVWNIDADDRIPAHAILSRPLELAEKLQCDILHCRAVGVRPPSPLHLPLLWTEPVAEELQSGKVFEAFMATDYPPAILWNKFFSNSLTQKIVSAAPAIEVRFFDVKFFGILSLLFAQSYHACNEVIYEYSMRLHRPAELYARQVASMILLREHLTPAVARENPAELSAFHAWCDRRLTIQTGHLCIMAWDELRRLPAQEPQSIGGWLKDNIFIHLSRKWLFQALAHSLRANSQRLHNISRSLLALYGVLPANIPETWSCGWEKLAAALSAPNDSGNLLRLARYGMEIADGIADSIFFPHDFDGQPAELHALRLLLANAALAKMITSILAPQVDITKKAN